MVPPGGVPVTVAVLTTRPASMSAWVTVWVPVHVVDAPGGERRLRAGDAGRCWVGHGDAGDGHVADVGDAERVRDRLRRPAGLAVVVDDLTIDSAGFCTPVIVTWFDGTGGIGVPPGGVPTTVAVLTTDPASTSACVTVWVAVHVVDAPGASVVDGHDDAGRCSASVTAMPVIVTLPVLVTRNVYGIVWPTGGIVAVGRRLDDRQRRVPLSR